MFQQGKQQRQRGDLSAALKSWEKALKLYLKLGDIDSLKKSVEIFHDIGYREQEAKLLSNLGNSYESMTQYKEAIEVYKKSLAIFKELGKRNEEAGVYSNLGNIYNSLGQYQLAIDSLEKSVKIYEELGDRQNKANPLGNLGNSYYFRGEYDLAIDYYKQSLAIEQEFHRDSNDAAITLIGLGNAYIFLNKYQEAIDYCKQSLQISQKLGVPQTEANALGSLGYAYGLMRQFKKSIDFSEQSLTIFKKLDDRMGTANSLNNIGDSLFLIGDLPGAEKRLREGMELLEDIRQRLGSNDSAKVAMFDRHLSTYRTLQQVLVARKKPEEALEIAERGRARAFVELLLRRLSPQQQEIVPVPYPSLTEIKQTARTENATIVQYSVLHDSELYIWVIKPTGKISFHRSDFSSLLQSSNPHSADVGWIFLSVVKT
ncbi:tetratricopeptide repeat protein [Microcoleus sp. CAWBG58]|uniref:tetratricopeptide repeat protein n=1 Tax=Microcoleus sp. CAWBG58 TaxID=2841651 RepID=UPI0025FF7DA8|nr:tetratricopeptide repeat protein [Microcoleus sp. CAWBG58]